MDRPFLLIFFFTYYCLKLAPHKYTYSHNYLYLFLHLTYLFSPAFIFLTFLLHALRDMPYLARSKLQRLRH